MRHLQFLKEDDPELLGGVDIKFFSRQFIDLFFQLHDTGAQLVAVYFQSLCLYLNSRLFHIKQGKHKRHLYLIKKGIHACLF